MMLRYLIGDKGEQLNSRFESIHHPLSADENDAWPKENPQSDRNVKQTQSEKSQLNLNGKLSFTLKLFHCTMPSLRSHDPMIFNKGHCGKSIPLCYSGGKIHLSSAINGVCMERIAAIM